MTAPIGHNTIAGEQIKSIVARVENLESEKKEIADQIKEVYAEAKANGLDTKILRKVVKERKRSAEEREEEATLLDLYMHAIGMLAQKALD